MSRLKKLKLDIGRDGLTKSTSDTNPIQDISTDEMTRTVTLSDIANYERNPRIHNNAVYEQLKDSLRASGGFKGTLEATVPPASGGFITYRGGGTRLMALKELFDETGHADFNRVKIVVLPYPGDAQLIANHLAENENRGDLTFIERALGVMDLKRAMDDDNGDGAPLSDAEFTRRVTQMGFKVVRSRMPVYRFAAETLQPLLPLALPSMGRPQIEVIIAMRKALDAYSAEINDTDMADTVWLVALTDIDKPDLTPERIRSALAACLAEQRGIDPGDASGILNPTRKATAATPTVGPDTRSAAASSTTSPLKPFPAALSDCVEHTDDLSTFNVSAPLDPFDTTASDYAASCVSWHLLRRLDPTCRPRQETIESKVGTLSPEVLAQLNNDQLSRIFTGFTSLHKRLKKRDAEKP